MSPATRPVIHATPDPRLAARLVRRTPLHYAEGPSEELDRPAHVRAGSGVAHFGQHLVVVQDDANFLALVDPATGRARAVPLPAGEDGRRQFDDRRGNKHHKLDLEAVFVAPGADGNPLLVALGSGSTPRRERIVTARLASGVLDEESIAVHDGAALYTALRADPDFAPGELNVEGALYRDGQVWLFGRGNGAPRDGRPAASATCELTWDDLRAYLTGTTRTTAPELRAPTQYQLGELDGLGLGFTDAALAGDGQTLLFVAAAEDSPDATRDGRVAGSVLGVVDPDGDSRWTLIRDLDGSPVAAKIEGIIGAASGRSLLYAVIDQDDPDTPSELCEIELDGPWMIEPAPTNERS
jgi:hypothetical protein